MATKRGPIGPRGLNRFVFNGREVREEDIDAAQNQSLALPTEVPEELVDGTAGVPVFGDTEHQPA